jgi:hypothetical protein
MARAATTTCSTSTGDDNTIITGEGQYRRFGDGSGHITVTDIDTANDKCILAFPHLAAVGV